MSRFPDRNTSTIDHRSTSMINRVILIGNLTRDAESVAGARTAFTRLRLATNTVWRDAEGNRQESVEYHSVVAFGRTAEVCAEYGVRGRRVYIEGRLRTRDFEGSDGLRRHTTEIVAESIRWLDRRDPSSTEAVAEGDGEGDTAGAQPELAVAGASAEK
jgi:single-strand DNA-binding protein